MKSTWKSVRNTQIPETTSVYQILASSFQTKLATEIELLQHGSCTAFHLRADRLHKQINRFLIILDGTVLRLEKKNQQTLPSMTKNLLTWKSKFSQEPVSSTIFIKLTQNPYIPAKILKLEGILSIFPHKYLCTK